MFCRHPSSFEVKRFESCRQSMNTIRPLAGVESAPSWKQKHDCSEAPCKHNKYRYQPRRQWERNPYPSASYDWQRTRLPMNSSNLCTSRRGNQARKKPTKPTPSSTDKATAPAGTNSVPPSDNPNEIDKHKNTQVCLQPGKYTFGVHFRASYRKTGNKKAPQPLRL
ncbi:MAG: hypothetical protein ACFWT0_00810 [Bifidobacterium crudilactis]|jgi:hypothetical protein